MQTTREYVREFSRAFGRPVNDSLVDLSVADRLLLGKLLLEETLEYIFKGLKLQLHASDMISSSEDNFDLSVQPNAYWNPTECADGLGDVNIVIHFAAHWQGFNLDRVTSVINDSNMSKLGADGKPIVNGETPGYRDVDIEEKGSLLTKHRNREEGFDPSKPIGKILKGPNYRPATYDIIRILTEENNNAE